MNHTFYRYKLETADLYNPDTREVSVVFLGESGGRLRISLPADDARRLINSWGPLLLKDMQRYDHERVATSYSPVIKPRTLAPGELLTDASAASPAGTPGKADTVGDDFFSMWVGTYDGEARRDPADAEPVPMSMLFDPETSTAHIRFRYDEREAGLSMSMDSWRKLRRMMLDKDENGHSTDTMESQDATEVDAVVSALAALTDRVRALEERDLDALCAEIARSFKEPRT